MISGFKTVWLWGNMKENRSQGCCCCSCNQVNWWRGSWTKHKEDEYIEESWVPCIFSVSDYVLIGGGRGFLVFRILSRTAGVIGFLNLECSSKSIHYHTTILLLPSSQSQSQCSSSQSYSHGKWDERVLLFTPSIGYPIVNCNKHKSISG